MKYIFLAVLICQVSCSIKKTGFAQNKEKICNELDRNTMCEGLCEIIRNNFFYNDQDSLFVENHTLRYLLVSQYRDCLASLTEAELIGVFGTPSLIDEDGTILYYSNSFNKSTAAIAYGLVQSGYIRTQRNKHGSLSRKPIEYLKSTVLQCPEYIEPVSKFEPHVRKEYPKHCLERKKNLYTQIFYHKKEEFYIVNSLMLDYLHFDNGDSYPCIESFALSEIEQLFSEAGPSNLDTISIPVYSKPILRETKEGVLKNSMPVIQFKKLDSGLYRASFEWSD